MNTSDLHCQQLLSLKEMVKISLGIAFINITPRSINRSKIVFPLFVTHIHCSIISEKQGIASISRWHYTIKHVYTTFNGFQNILWSTYTHEITRLFFW